MKNLRDRITGITGGVAILAIFSFLGGGCAPSVTFPADGVSTAVENIARELYQIDVVSRISGKTIGVMVYSDRLIDESGQALAEGTQEMIGNLMLTVTRVALSTDHDVDFVVVALREKDKPMELRLTRYLVDIKRAQTEAIPITESINRTVWENKQYRIDPVNRSYFPLKDVVFEEFLANQTIQRLRYQKKEPKEDEKEAEEAFVPDRLVEGKFKTTMIKLEEKRIFEFTVLAFADFHSGKHILDVLGVVSEVFEGYKFTGFDELWIRNLLGRMSLKIDRETLERYQEGELTDEAISKMFVRATSRS